LLPLRAAAIDTCEWPRVRSVKASWEEERETLDLLVWQVSAPVHVAKGTMQWQCEKLDESLRQQPQTDRGGGQQQQQQQRVPVVCGYVRAPEVRACQRTGLGVQSVSARMVSSCYAHYNPAWRTGMPDEVHKVKSMNIINFDFVKKASLKTIVSSSCTSDVELASHLGAAESCKFLLLFLLLLRLIELIAPGIKKGVFCQRDEETEDDHLLGFKV